MGSDRPRVEAMKVLTHEQRSEEERTTPEHGSPTSCPLGSGQERRKEPPEGEKIHRNRYEEVGRGRIPVVDRCLADLYG